MSQSRRVQVLLGHLGAPSRAAALRDAPVAAAAAAADDAAPGVLDVPSDAGPRSADDSFEAHGAAAAAATQGDAAAAASVPRAMPPLRRRAVLVTGVRTPFIKSFGQFMKYDTIALGVHAVAGLLRKTGLSPEHIDQIIWGSVVIPNGSPNVAREIVIDLNLPREISGVTVSRACISGLQAVIDAVNVIDHGDSECIIAGGGDSTSNAELILPKHMTHALARYQYGGNKQGAAGMLALIKGLGSPLTWGPKGGAVAERSTGKTMGYHADLMALINEVPRDAQDKLAIASHEKAAAARERGYFKDEVVPVGSVRADNIIRGKQDPKKVASLGPVFRKSGTVTAATSSPLTDGASAVLVMSEEKARMLNYPTDIVLRAYSQTATDPFPQLLLAPAVAIPRALEKAGLTLDDIDVFEIHEAFAAQVLATIACLQSDAFARKYLGRAKAVGTVPLDKVNPNGSSIAIGHPFAATGGRLINAAAEHLRRNKLRFALISVCAAGGLGCVAIIERRDA